MSNPHRSVRAALRRAVAAHLNRSERGITLLLFALAIVVLLGMVAIGIDGGRLYDERRQAQNAADHAALAAAYSSCTSTSSDPTVLLATAVAAGLASADENGYDDNGTSNDVAITVAPGSAATDHQYQARVDTTIGTTFANVIGFSEVSTSGLATAQASGCDPTGSGVPAVFGGGDCPGYEKEIDISGENHRFEGLVHTNGDFYQSASNSEFINGSGPSVTYVGAFEGKKGNNNIYELPEQQVTLQTWPTGFDPTVMTTAFWNLYKTSPDRVPLGSDTSNKFNITTDGIYYTESASEVVIEAVANNAKFTVISTRAPVRFPNELNGVYHAFPDNPPGTPANIIVASGYDPPLSDKCSKMGFLYSGNSGTWNGIYWVPKSTIEWSGNGATINGGLLGWGLKMNGNDHIVRGGTGLGGAHPDVLLTE